MSPLVRSVITGQVRDSAGLPASGVRVRAFVLGIRDATPIGDAVQTGDDGRYSIAFPLRGERSGPPSVRVVAYDEADAELASQTHYGRETQGDIDVLLPPRPSPQSQFERYDDALTPLLNGFALTDVQRGDRTFLAGASGVPAADLDTIVQAARSALAERERDDAVMLPAAVWYAWQRDGLGLDHPTDALVDSVSRAIDDGVVPEQIGQEIGVVAEGIEQLKLDAVLAAPRLGTTSLGGLLATTPQQLDAGQQRAIAAVVTDGPWDDPNLADGLRAAGSLDAPSADRVVRTLRLGALTGGHLPLVQALQDELADDDGATTRPLAALGASDWLQLAYDHGTPDAQLSPDDYADRLAAAVERAHPTATLHARLRDGGRLALQPILAEVGAFLDDNPGFDVTTATAGALLDGADLRRVDDKEQLATGLLALKRLNTLGASWDESARLLEGGIASPQHLVAAGPGQLVAGLDDLIDADRVRELHTQARRLHDAAFAGFTSAFASFAGPAVLPGADSGADGATGDNGAAPADRIDWASSVALVPRKAPPPTWDIGDVQNGDVGTKAAPSLSSMLQRLFGPQDACACEDCGSVLSPAAYFADLLKFAVEADLTDVLFARRPDLQDLELSCANTKTEVPSIDLALEALENAVALPLDVDLPPGTDILAQLRGARVGEAVQRALLHTVLTLSGPAVATFAGAAAPGTSDWTVLDGRRRWTLTARPDETFTGKRHGAGAALLDTTGLDTAALAAALDAGAVPDAAKPAFARLYSGALDPGEFRTTVTQDTADRAWRVDYEFVAHLIVDAAAPRVALQTPGGEVWWQITGPAAVDLITTELQRSADAPKLVQKQFRARFGSRRARVTQKGEVWIVRSERFRLVLERQPARLTITSLAYQSGDPTADPRAWPENHNPEAYDRLAAAVFPFSLPLDLPLEHVRLFLARARSSRGRLQEVLHERDPRRLAIETLGMSAAEADIVAPAAAPADADIYDRWGVPAGVTGLRDAATGRFVTGAPLDLLADVSILLEQARLELADLRVLLATRFVAQDSPLTLTPLNSCVPSEMRVNGLTAGHLDRLMRIVRLRRRLGWSVATLDAAIPMTAATIDPPLLLRLADLARLVTLLDIPADALVKWFSPHADAAAQALGLAAGLRMSSTELAHALALLAPDASPSLPFATPGALLAFAQDAKACAAAGVTFEVLRYVLRHDETPGADVTLEPGERRQLMSTLRDAVTAIPDVQPPGQLSWDDRQAALEFTAVARQLAATTRAAREQAAITTLARLLRAGRDLVQALLDGALRDSTGEQRTAIELLVDWAAPPGPDVAPPDSAADSVLLRLYKSVVLCNALRLTAPDLKLLRPPPATDKGTGLTVLRLDSLPVAPVADPQAIGANVTGFRQLAAVVALRARTTGASDLLRHYAALDFTSAHLTADAEQLLAVGLELAPGVVSGAAGRLGINHAEHYRDPASLTALIDLLVELKQLGTDVDDAVTLIAPSPDAQAATTARELLCAKYDAASRRDLIMPLADTLRSLQRDALVDLLVARDRLAGADDLYDRYLIDVQTGSCMVTTRILLATAAVQLFVQRVMLNLEPGLSLSADKCELWEWMHSYRIWEANRRVYLFPENWLLQELRDDTTVTARAADSALTEHEPSLASARGALLGYLDELGQLAQISVISMYEDERRRDARAERTLYVVGRTPNQPYRYYVRECSQFGDASMTWSGWEPLNTDNANDFILPFVMEGDLHLAWPIFRKTRDERTDALLWEVTLAWQRRTASGWTKRQISNDLLSTRRLRSLSELRSFVITLTRAQRPIPMAPSLVQDLVTIACYAAVDPAAPPEYAPQIDDPQPPYHGVDAAAFQRNVSLTLGAQVWQKYKLASSEDGYVYRPAKGMTVYAGGVAAGNDPGDTNSYPYYRQASVGADGRVSLYIPSTQNGGDVTLSFFHDGTLVRKLKGTLSDQNNPNFMHWYWDPVLVFEIPMPADTPYLPDRRVTFGQAVGSFELTAGRDARVNVPAPAATPRLDTANAFAPGMRLGNRFVNSTTALDADGKRSVTLFPGSPPLEVRNSAGATLQITRAVATAGAHDLWFLQDDAGRYYVEHAADGFRVWPDDQDVVAPYRDIAGVSEFALFDRDIEGMTRGGSTSPGLSATSPSIDFARHAPPAIYWWELLLHLPFAFADHLAANGRFADARRWLHAVFDPTTAEVDGAGVPQFWRFLPFVNGSQPAAIQTLLTWLADPSVNDPADPDAEARLAQEIEAWRENPFMPHLVARMRPSAYQWYAFFAYLDVLIGWGDQLFRRDTRESVNDATLLYVLAAKLLGPRPRVSSPTVPPTPRTYRSLPWRENVSAPGEQTKLDEFANAWVSWSDVAGIARQATNGGSHAPLTASRSWLPPTEVLTTIGHPLFCIPRNDKLTGYYDLLQQRLFDVRHCRNIDGVERALALYDPPIDPLLLIRAKAAGLDLDSVVAAAREASGTGPAPIYRFSSALQRALELTAEVKALGAALLSALEKRDAEALALLRSSNEVAMNALVHDVRDRQVAEADAAIAALEQSKDSAMLRFTQCQHLLGKPVPTIGGDGLPVVEQSSALTVSTDATGDAGALGLARKEVDQLALSVLAHEITQVANAVSVVGAILALFPNIFAGTPFAGQTTGGANFANAVSAAVKATEMLATAASFEANRLGTFAGYERRQDEWVHQSKLALAELKQIDAQLITATIRREIAQLELRNHEQQIEHSRAADSMMRDKFTNQELFRWQSGQLADVYHRSYQLALDQARRAERAFRLELGTDDSTTYVGIGYWDNLKQGLLAGEQLHHDLKRMESAFYERNAREYEITKHVSLALVDPLALMTLKTSNSAIVSLPETLFDIDFPGHYFRRIKSVSLTIPCVVGPYASVNCTLGMERSQIRVSTASDPYPREDDDDPRFRDQSGMIQSIVTSSGQNDSGLFETNLRDERFLPFEGAGVISQWKLSLPDQFQPFDYSTITDVIMHVRYTSRDGGSGLKQAASAALKDYPAVAAGGPMALLVSLRHDFPSEWARLVAAGEVGEGNRSQTFTIARDRFPAVLGTRPLNVTIIDVFTSVARGAPASPGLSAPGNPALDVGDAQDAGAFRHQRVTPAAAVQVAQNAAADWTLTVSEALRATLRDIVLVLTYTA